jgi:parallel beta-helix repeat protein
VFQVNGAEDVTIANLGITGARHGVSVVANSGSSNVTIFGNDIFENLEDGIRIESGNSHIEILDNRIFDNGYYGVELYSEDSLVRGNEVYSNSAQGWSWLAGIYARNASNRIENNVVHSNVGRGIYSWQSQVIGNTVSGHASSQSSGIYLENASAQDNVVYSNHRGIEIASNRDAAIVSNRIYNNTEGIRISGSGRATLQGNRIYSNATGVLVVGPTDWWGSLRELEALNNLIYSNTNIALDIRNKVGLNLANNTIYQPVGDAVQIDSYQDNPSGPPADSHVYNNIFWVEAGPLFSVTDDAQSGLDSDYNLFHLTGEGTVGLWGGRYYDSWADWHFEVGFDANSLQADPLFTDAMARMVYSDSAMNQCHRQRSSTMAVKASASLATGRNSPMGAMTAVICKAVTIRFRRRHGSLRPSRELPIILPLHYCWSKLWNRMAKYSVYDGDRLIYIAQLHQGNISWSFTEDGVSWRHLASLEVESQQLRVVLTGNDPSRPFPVGRRGPHPTDRG